MLRERLSSQFLKALPSFPSETKESSGFDQNSPAVAPPHSDRELIGGHGLVGVEEEMGSAAGGDDVGKEERILVSVRVRPPNERELERSDVSDWECINADTIIFKNSLPERSMFPTTYTFDRVFGCEINTRQVYEEGAKEVALSVLSGVNSSIFAYGQTSSGKTYTMTGITKYSVSDIYDYIQKHEEREFILKFSAMEIYNEAVRDLLSPDSAPLRLLDDPEKGTIVEKLTEETLRDQDHLKELLSFCLDQRQIGETSLNEMSSRSHQILRLTIESSAREFSGKGNLSTLAATMNFVDLAGSERASHALTAGTRLKEGCHINRSLLTLGTVIRKLSLGLTVGNSLSIGEIIQWNGLTMHLNSPPLDGLGISACSGSLAPHPQTIKWRRIKVHGEPDSVNNLSSLLEGRNGHIPYRDSKLTRILQSSLGGNAKTAIICTMSPARTHIEQSRNTLLFASCAKEVVNNAQVNLVVSDKALVKHLQRELVRLESEMRCIVPSSTSNPEALKEKDAQIRKMEREMKELMQQRDLAQSRLEDLLKALGDDQGSRQWEELSQYSISRSPNSYKDTFSTYESSQSHDFGNAKFDSLSGSKGCTEPHLQLYGKTKEEHVVLPLNHSASTTSSMGQEEVSEFTSHDFEDHYKEVQYIEMVEPNMNIIKDCNLFLTEESDCLLSPSIHAQEPASLKPKPKEEKDWALEPSPIPLVKISSRSRSQALARSRSCRATMTSTSSPWFREEKENVDTSPTIFLEVFPGRYEGRHYSINLGAELEKCSQDVELHTHSRDGSISQASEKSSDDVLKPQDIKSCPDEGVTNISKTAEGMKEMAKMQYQKRLADGQETENSTNYDSGVKVTVNDVCLEPTLESSHSSSRWPLEFEKKQRDIVELWHACSVSLIHRSYFFLLIKGDPTDSFYIEVEYRRLSFLKNSYSEGSVDKTTAEADQNGSFALSLKNLRGERKKLCRGLNRFSAAQRDSLYTKWGIPLDSKKRRLQLSQRVWTDTKDMERMRESAMLVAKVFRFLEPAQAPKEMFGLSFTQQLTSRRSFGWRN